MSLLEAAENGNVDKVKQLLAEGSPVDQVRSVNGAASLHLASLEGHTEVMRHLLAAGASRDVAAGGYTPLDLAKGSNRTAAVELLNEWPEKLRLAHTQPQSRGMAEGTWSCPTCTFDNHHLIAVCEMCGTPKPDQVDSQQQARPVTKTMGSWANLECAFPVDSPDFVKGKRVARGAFGAVYRGMYKNNPVASKQHHALSAAGIEMYGLADDPEYFRIVVQEIEDEIIALVSLHHPRIMELVGIAVGDYEGTPTPEFIVTE